ncbi:hypothetical protein tpqmel_0955 [Candidatus Gastranaerophilus sp. (ex Termes propinquus)]|nr:hypothetical protein tpqmel_0955 [Candidatus Gastranaerophilus sp. (ex Termes propinquus)]
MREVESFENLMVEYGQMLPDDALCALYDLNRLKDIDKKEKKIKFDIAQMWSWA